MSLINALSRLFDNGERLTLPFLDDFDFDATLDTLMKRGNELYGGFNDFMKTVKDTITDFKVVVPFDERNETFKFEVAGNTLKVRVDGKNGFRETSASIPANCNVDELRHFINRKKRELVVVIPKKISEDENVKKAKEALVNKVNTTVDWLKDALAEKKKTAESVAKSTTPPTTKKGGGHRKYGKVVRDGKGRFVSSAKKGE